MKRVGKIVIGLVVAVIAAGGVYMKMSQKEEAVKEDVRPAVEVGLPEVKDITLYTDVIGTIEPSETVTVTPKMSGEALEVLFEAGEYVQEGQILCRIDSDALTALKIQVDSAQVSMNDANTNLQRMQVLFAGGTISQQQLEQSQSAATGARLQYEAAKNQYDLQLKYTTVTAPISGVIESRNIDPHDMLSPSVQVCVISVKDQIMINFSVPERVMKNLQTGMEVTLDKYGTTYTGTITEIASAVNEASGLYEIKAGVENGSALSTGSKAKVTVMKDQVKNVLTVPLRCVSYDDGNPFIYIYDNGIAKRVDIESGIYDTEYMEVKSGIKNDSQVIVTWSNELTDGVEVLKTDASTAQSGAAETEATESSAENNETADAE